MVDLTPVVPQDTPVSTEAKGIFQSDLIFRTGLILALRDLRAHPYLIDYCFAGLLEDDETSTEYGARERDKAKAWFLRTDIPVVMDYNIDPPQGHMISVAVVDSTETEATLADVHYVVEEDVESSWPVLLGPFTPEGYDPATGTVTLAAADQAQLVVVAGMLLIDRAGRQHPVLSVPDPNWSGRFRVQAGLVLDLTGATIKGAVPALKQPIESLNFKEVYRVGCHGLNEAYYCSWLHALVVFCLLRYKQRFFEARGIERSTISSGPLALDQRWSKIQQMFTRFVTFSSTARNFWPKDTATRIGETVTQPTYSKVNEVATAVTPGPDFSEEDAPWLAQDGTGIVIP